MVISNSLCELMVDQIVWFYQIALISMIYIYIYIYTHIHTQGRFYVYVHIFIYK